MESSTIKAKHKELHKFLERDLGCCRCFLVCFLWRVWQYLQALKGNVPEITMSFTEEMLYDWSEQAKNDCMRYSVEMVWRFGGMEPSESVVGCFWNSPENFDPWWNFCHYTRSFRALVKGMFKLVSTDCILDNQRKAFLLQIIALMTNVKSHDGLRKKDLGFKEIVQVKLPVEMPMRPIVSPYYYTFLTIEELEFHEGAKIVKRAAVSFDEDEDDLVYNMSLDI